MRPRLIVRHDVHVLQITQATTVKHRLRLLNTRAQQILVDRTVLVSLNRTFRIVVSVPMDPADRPVVLVSFFLSSANSRLF